MWTEMNTATKAVPTAIAAFVWIDDHFGTNFDASHCLANLDDNTSKLMTKDYCRWRIEMPIQDVKICAADTCERNFNHHSVWAAQISETFQRY